jgi:hypothetical protein
MNINLIEAAIYKHILITIEIVKSKEVNIDIEIFKNYFLRLYIFLESCIQIYYLISIYEIIKIDSITILIYLRIKENIIYIVLIIYIDI